MGLKVLRFLRIWRSLCNFSMTGYGWVVLVIRLKTVKYRCSNAIEYNLRICKNPKVFDMIFLIMFKFFHKIVFSNLCKTSDPLANKRIHRPYMFFCSFIVVLICFLSPRCNCCFLFVTIVTIVCLPPIVFNNKCSHGHLFCFLCP